MSICVDVRQVDPKAEPSAIKRKYYVLARKYHPDKNDSQEAADKFKDIAEAYQVLSDPQLREKYDLDGREALSGDKTAVNEDSRPDPSILLAFLFGSDKFNDYIGRLATSTSAMLGDSPKLSIQDARKLQERRVTRLALILADKVEPWTKEDYDLCKVQWKTEAEALVSASYGWELIQALGMAYEVAAVQFLGSTESGIGMPSIGKWAEGRQAAAKGSQASKKNQFKTMMASLDAMKLQMEYQEKIAKAATDEEKQQLQREMEEATQDIMLKIIWTTTVVGKYTRSQHVVRVALPSLTKAVLLFSFAATQISPPPCMKCARWSSLTKALIRKPVNVVPTGSRTWVRFSLPHRNLQPVRRMPGPCLKRLPWLQLSRRSSARTKPPTRPPTMDHSGQIDK